MDFWQRTESILASHEIVIDRPKGSWHPRFPEIIYPLGYGYLKGTSGGDGNEIDVWKGSLNGTKLVGVICTVDSNKNDAEIKLLVDCTEAEIQLIERFYRDNQFMSAIILKRDKTRL
jgi:inorganic pyrophosphatase